MTDTPPFECGPECPAPDHHGLDESAPEPPEPEADLEAWVSRGPSASYAEWAAEGKLPEPEAGTVSVYGPQEATTADVATAIESAEEVTRGGGNYVAAWEAAQVTSDNQWHAATREAQAEASEPEAEA